MIISASSYALRAQAYCNRCAANGANLTALQQGATLRLTKALDDIGLAKFLAVYPFLGAVAGTTKLNLLSEAGTYDLTWAGGITHGAAGVTGNGTTGYGNTGLAETALTEDSHHLAVYQRGSESAAFRGHGLARAGGVAPIVATSYDVTTNQAGQSNGVIVPVTAAPTVLGLLTLSRTSYSSATLYQGGTVAGTNTTDTSGVTKAAQNLFLLARNDGTGTAELWASAQIGFASVGTGLTAAEVTALWTAVQTWATELGRNV